jgi:hypothetical protein
MIAVAASGLRACRVLAQLIKQSDLLAGNLKERAGCFFHALPPHHSPLMPAALMIGHHFRISAL